jgi:hypothetical protein
MGIAAGGLIKQTIHRDTHDPDSWDRSSTITFNVQILNASLFQQVTGIPAPKCPIDITTYLNLGLPFFDLHEEKSPIKGNFDDVKPISEISASGEPFRDAHSWKSYTVIGLNPDGTRRVFRTVSGLEEEVSKYNAASFADQDDIQYTPKYTTSTQGE